MVFWNRISYFIERKISFVLHEPDNESEGSSKSNVTIHGEDIQNNEKEKKRSIQATPGRPFLLRRGTTANAATGSFKRRSLKLRRNTKEGKEIEVEACKYNNCYYWLFCNAYKQFYKNIGDFTAPIFEKSFFTSTLIKPIFFINVFF